MSHSSFRAQSFFVVLACALGSLAPGCTKPPTALVVAIASEANPPKEIDAIEIEVDRGGSTPFIRSYPLGDGADTKLPGTIALSKDTSSDASETIVITIKASRPGKDGVILRKARIGFSEDKTKLLRMPLRYSCYDFDNCGDGQTCIGGTCQSDAVDVESLPDFDGSDPFPIQGAGTCFDARPEVCLADKQAVDLSGLTAPGSTCLVPIGEPSGKLNLAAHWFAQDAATDADRLIVLDNDGVEGWTFADASHGAFQLSKGVCDAVKAGRITQLYYSAACTPKQLTQPTCQPPSGTGLGLGGSSGTGGSAGSGGITAAGGHGIGGSGGTSVGGQGGGLGHSGMSGTGGSSGASGHSGMSGASGNAGVSGMGGGGGVSGASGMGGVGGASGAAGSSAQGGSGGAAGSPVVGPAPVWSKILGLGTGNDDAHGVAVASNGDVIWSGDFTTELVFDASHSLVADGPQHCFIARLDPSGNHLWSHHWGDPSSFNCITEGATLSLSPDGNTIAFGGKFNTTLDFGTSQLAPLVGQGDFDGLVVDLDPNGVVRWAKAIGGMNEDNVLAVAAGPQGQIAAGGLVATSLDLGAGPLTAAGGTDAFVVVYDTTGAILWGHLFGDTADQRVTGLAYNSAGELYVTGNFAGSIDLGAGPLSASGTSDAFVARFDGSGQLLALRTFGGHATNTAFGVSVNPALGHPVVGMTYEGGLAINSVLLPDGGGSNVLLLELDGSLMDLRTLAFPSLGPARGTAVSFGADGSLGMSGTFSQGIDLGPSGKQIVNGDPDAFFVKIDRSFSVEWGRAIGGTKLESAEGIALSKDGRVVASGYVEESVDLGGGIVPAAGGYDALLASYPGAIAKDPVASGLDHPGVVATDGSFVYYGTVSNPAEIRRCPFGVATCAKPELVTGSLPFGIVTSIVLDGTTLYGSDYNEIWSCDLSQTLPCAPAIYYMPPSGTFPGPLALDSGFLTWGENVAMSQHQLVTCATGASCGQPTLVAPAGGVLDNLAITGIVTTPNSLYVQDFYSGQIYSAMTGGPGTATSSAFNSVAAPLIVAAAGLTLRGDSFFFSTQVDGGYVYRCSLSGGCGGLQPIAGPEGTPQRVAVSGSSVYWVDGGDPDGSGGLIPNTGTLRTTPSTP